MNIDAFGCGAQLFIWWGTLVKAPQATTAMGSDVRRSYTASGRFSSSSLYETFLIGTLSLPSTAYALAAVWLLYPVRSPLNLYSLIMAVTECTAETV